ncbi:MAG: hypothetical protein ABIT96_03785 [Ferruginibacter sp.]
MEKLIVAYLMRHQHCPLAHTGSLQMVQVPSRTDISAHLIAAPENEIYFSAEEKPAGDFLEYLSEALQVPVDKASACLGEFCNRLSDLDAFAELYLPAAGKFFVDADGNLQFRSQKLPAAFYPDVAAERVVHPQAVHQMLVGDKETDTGTMTAYYETSDAGASRRWWLPAFIVLLAALALISFYYFSHPASATGGNAMGITLDTPGETYRANP